MNILTDFLVKNDYEIIVIILVKYYEYIVGVSQ